MISSNLARRSHPGRVFVALHSTEGTASVLRLDSVIMTDNLATVLDSEVHSILGHLPDLAAVQTALDHTFALDGPTASPATR